MLLDSDHNLYVIEVNQHPNIYPGPPHEPNRYVYESLLYDLFSLIGVGTRYRKSSLQISKDIEMMIAHPHSMQVKPQLCLSKTCETCNGNCKMCWKCQTVSQKYSRFLGYLEQMNLGEFKRLFPAGSDEYKKFQLSKESKNHAEWFREMCKKNRNFC